MGKSQWRLRWLWKVSVGLPLLSEQTHFLKHVSRKCPADVVSVPCWGAVSSDYSCNIKPTSWPGLSSKKAKCLCSVRKELLSFHFPGLWKISCFISRMLKTCFDQADYPDSEEGKRVLARASWYRYICFVWSQAGGGKIYSQEPVGVFLLLTWYHT